MRPVGTGQPRSPSLTPGRILIPEGVFELQKNDAFRNVLLNAVRNPSTSFSEHDFYIRMVDTLTVDQCCGSA